MDFRVNPGDNGAVIGKKGSGKTEFVKNIVLDQFDYWVVLDNKGEFGNIKNSDGTRRFYMPGVALVHDLDLLHEASLKYNKIVYRPDVSLEANNTNFKQEMDAFFWWNYMRRTPLLYVDEATAVCDSYNILPGHNAIMKRGRELGISCFNGTQDPVNVHNTLFSQSDHFIVFKVLLEAHRKKLASFMGEGVLKAQSIPKYHFYYYNESEMDSCELMKPIVIKEGR